MNDIKKLGAIEIRNKIINKEITCLEAVNAFISEIEKSELNAVIEIFYDAIETAKEMDKDIKPLPLFGVPMLIKDNISIKGKTASCASNFLKDYVSPYDSTVIKKLKAAGAIFIGRTNMDEFAMGASNETSAFGPAKNAIDPKRVPGGSSGGSASAVKANLCAAALGTDTGGSIRQPSSFNGVYGLKPTYGKVSRYGVVAFASSLDQVGPITKNIEDSILITNIISGKDDKDMTTIETEQVVTCELKDLKGKVYGISSEIIKLIDNMKEKKLYYKVFEFLARSGADIKIIQTKNLMLCLPIYYILSPAEAASNLGRFDGVKYTRRSAKADGILDIYNMSRTEGFGKEVKRRIMLGNYVLSSGYYDAYYLKAKKLQQKIIKEMNSFFSQCDCMLLPTTPNVAFKFGEKSDDPVEMYAQDLFTVIANITEIPAISVPCGNGEYDMPMGLQIAAKKCDENKIFELAAFISKNRETK